MIDPVHGSLVVAKAAGKLATSYGVKRLIASLDPSKRLKEAWEENKEDYLFETGSKVDALAAQVEDLEFRVTENEAARALSAGVFEAIQSTERARIELLAAAFVGFVSADVQADLRHRAYRVALNLEPSDVACMIALRHWEPAQRKAWEAWGMADPKPPSTPELLHPIRPGQFEIEFAVIQAPGCIGTVPGFPPHVTFASPPFILNSLGHAVLDLVSSTTPNQS